MCRRIKNVLSDWKFLMNDRENKQREDADEMLIVECDVDCNDTTGACEHQI